MEPYPMEPSADEMRAMGEAALEMLVGFVEGLDDAPASDTEGALALAATFKEQAPEFGEPFEKLLASIGEASAKGYETAGPGFLAYIPGGGLYASALAALIGFGMNRYVNLGPAAPALVQMEASVLRWMADMFDHPPEGLGILTSGGSLANLSAIVTARRALLPEDFLRGTMYASEHTHHSVEKSALLAGFPTRNVRVVPSTSELRMDVDALHDMVDADRRAGMMPFCVIGNGGTTDTGTIDPLVDLVAVAHERRMWVHVDAAYGGFFQLTDRGRARLRGIVGADSITLDPHKGLFLPYGTGALLVRDGERLRAAHRLRAAYMQDLAGEDEVPSFSDYSPELSRDFRGLRVWLPIKLHGLGAFRDALDEKLDLAEHAFEQLRQIDELLVPLAPDLSTVAFRMRGEGDEADTRSAELLERVNATKRVFLSSTTLRGRFALRICILSHRTHRDRVDECLEIIRREAGAIVGRQGIEP